VYLQSDVVGGVDEYNTMVVRHTNVYWALTAPNITRMPSGRQILELNFFSNLYCTFSLIRERQNDITLIEY
jgi:hypothetical protein